MSTDSRGSATDVIPASNFFFKWSARRGKRSRSRRLLEAKEEQWREIMDLINLFPLSHHFPTDGKNGCLVLQYSQNDSMLDLSSRSCKTDTLHFHLPGPRGIGTGGLKDKTTAAWSEKGHGKMSHEDTKGAHTVGHPIRSIREAREWSVFSHVNPDVSGCRSRQISDTQQVLKNSWRAKELSLDESNGSDPLRSVDRLLIMLKSPHTTVGIPGSMKSQQN